MVVVEKVGGTRVVWGLFEGGLADGEGVLGAATATAADISHTAILLSMTFSRSDPFQNVSRLVNSSEQ